MKLVTNVFRTEPVGGVELHVFQATRELARRGHAVDLLYVEEGSLDAEYRRFCHSVTQVPSVDYWFPWGRRGQAQQLARVGPAAFHTIRRRPDVIYGNRIFSTGWAIPASRLLGRPVVCHLHGFTQLSQRWMERLNREVDRYLIISQFTADEWFAAGLDPAKVDIVFNGIDPQAYPVGGLDERTEARAAMGVPDDAFVVTYFGRLDREKGVDVLLEAWRHLRLDPKEARLLIVGSSTVTVNPEGYPNELKALATEDVEFLGSRRDVVTPLHAADVVVVPSREEPFGRVVIEALATGRPVLASRVGGIPEILAGPLDRFLFDRGDVVQLADLLRSTRNWRDEEPGLADECVARVYQGFTLDDMVDGIESACRAVL